MTPDNDEDDEDDDEDETPSDDDDDDSRPMLFGKKIKSGSKKSRKETTKSSPGDSKPRKSVLAVSSHNAANVFAPDPNKSIWAKARQSEAGSTGADSVLGGGGASIFKKSKSKNSSGSSLFGPAGLAAAGKASGPSAANEAAVSTSFFGNQSAAGLGAPSGGLFGGGSIFGGNKSAFGGQGGAVFGGGEKDVRPNPIPEAAGKPFGGGNSDALTKFQANRGRKQLFFWLTEKGFIFFARHD